MKAVIQRVKKASVTVGSETVGRIGRGVLVFLGVGKDDTHEQADYLVKKISRLRLFDDGQGKMNLSAAEAKAGFLVVSQFTLYGDCAKGRRPSFDKAADPQKGKELYEYFVKTLRAEGSEVETGRFAAMMDVDLVNDGPVTFIIESR